MGRDWWNPKELLANVYAILSLSLSKYNNKRYFLGKPQKSASTNGKAIKRGGGGGGKGRAFKIKKQL